MVKWSPKFKFISFVDTKLLTIANVSFYHFTSIYWCFASGQKLCCVEQRNHYVTRDPAFWLSKLGESPKLVISENKIMCQFTITHCVGIRTTASWLSKHITYSNHWQAQYHLLGVLCTRAWCTWFVLLHEPWLGGWGHREIGENIAHQNMCRQNWPMKWRY